MHNLIFFKFGFKFVELFELKFDFMQRGVKFLLRFIMQRGVKSLRRMMLRGVKSMIFADIFPLNHAAGSLISSLHNAAGSQIFPLHFSAWRCDFLLHLAVGSQILPQ
jgi:hypothetical protein